MADNGPGSVRTASFLAGLHFVRVVMICVIQPLTGISLSLSAADSYAVYSHVIPLDSRRVCTQQHRPAGREDSVDASRCTELKFFWALARSVNNIVSWVLFCHKSLYGTPSISLNKFFLL